MKIRIEKLQKELSRGNAFEQYEALQEIKSFVLKSLSEEQNGLQANMSNIEDLINQVGRNLNGSSN
jgi:hypothetical protein